MKYFLNRIKKELKKNVDLEYKKTNQGFFKTELKQYGVRNLIVKKIAKDFYVEIKNFSKKEIFNLCEELLKSGYSEEAYIAFEWTEKRKNEFELKDFNIFDKWLKNYINDWSKCDKFCLRIIQSIIVKYPILISRVKEWSNSKNLWARRASAVSFITTHNKQYAIICDLDNIFEIANKLLLDKEDMVQKGYGWMLKAASVIKEKEVYDFVMARKNKMPRIALRYAIEKMPKNLRRKILKRDYV